MNICDFLVRASQVLLMSIYWMNLSDMCVSVFMWLSLKKRNMPLVQHDFELDFKLNYAEK